MCFTCRPSAFTVQFVQFFSHRLCGTKNTEATRTFAFRISHQLKRSACRCIMGCVREERRKSALSTCIICGHIGVRMCVSRSVCLSACSHVYLCLFVCLHACDYICRHVCVCVYAHVGWCMLHKYVHTPLCLRMCLCVCVYAYAFVCSLKDT